MASCGGVLLAVVFLVSCSTAGSKKVDGSDDAGDVSGEASIDAVEDGAAPPETVPEDVPGEAGKDVVCAPACEGKECGADGCGGQCGACEQGFQCTAGACVEVLGCETDGDCDPGFTCVEGACVQETCPATPCPEGSVCDEAAGVCVQCLTDADCPPNHHCSDQVCNEPVVCQSSKDCLENEVCDKASGVCVECVEDADCEDGFRCNALQQCEQILVCTSDKECKDYDMVCDKAIGECVECLGDSDCAATSYCAGATCLPDACDQAAAWPACVGSAVAQCNENGSVLTVLSQCGQTQYCLDAACFDWVCPPGQKGCKENSKFLCNDLGSDYVTIEECPAGFGCASGECVKVPCQPGAAACLDPKTQVICGQDAGAFTTVPCPDGQFCDGVTGACVPWNCIPSAKACDGTVAYVCDAFGSKKTVLKDCAPLGLACSQGECIECDPQCGDKQCGPDACGSVCGSCAVGQACLAGYCLAAGCSGPCVGKTVDDMVCAIDACYPTVFTAKSVASPTNDDISGSWEASAQFGTPGNGLAPVTAPSYAILTSGKIAAKVHSEDLAGGGQGTDPFSPDNIFDAVEFKLAGKVPAGVTGFSVNYIFMSTEYEEWIGSQFNDKFYIILKASVTTAGAAVVTNFGDCTDPGKYSDFTDPKGVKRCYVGINSAFSEPCAAPVTDIAGTGFECGPPGQQGGDSTGSTTGWLVTQWPLIPGEDFEITFHIHDTGDGIYDSLVILDNLFFTTVPITGTTIKGK
jgi:hypothetical protein